MSQEAPANSPEALDEARTTRFLFGFALLVVVLAVLFFAIWGLPGLTYLGLAATVLVFAMLTAYAAGF